MKVTFTLLGDRAHGEGGTAHTLSGRNLVTWIAKTEVEIARDATVYDVFTQVLDEYGYRYIGADSNYVSTIITPSGVRLSEFTNGKNSGWMYTVNGKHPDVGLKSFTLADGDDVVWHYTDDYTKEDGSDLWEEQEGSATVLRPEISVDRSGEAKAVLGQEEMEEALQVAWENRSDSIIIDPEISGNASKVSVELPRTSLQDMARQLGADLVLRTDLGTVRIPAAGVAELARESGATVTISIEELRSDECQVEVKVGNKPVTYLASGITATVPCRNAYDGTVLAIVDRYEQKIVKKSLVSGRTVIGVLDGSCTVRVVDNAKHFTDANHWAGGAIAFASAHELFDGVTSSTFAPNVPMSRAMLATVLFRLEGAGASWGMNPFTDVKNGTWYTDAVIWANSNRIVEGTGTGFQPDASVTREQMVTMLYRYVRYLGLDTRAAGSLSRFSDSGKVSDWAYDAMSWAVGSGIIDGKGYNTIDPKGTATRAEVATIMQRLVGLMVG